MTPEHPSDPALLGGRSGYATLLCGRTLGARYRIDRILDRGAMGIVYQGWDLERTQPVAVKVIDDQAYPADVLDVLYKRQVREAEAARLAKGRHVVKLLDHGQDSATGLCYLVLELLEGETLASLMRRKKLGLWEWLSLGASACSGLAQLHDAGVVHRDVKPANIFVRGSTATILDLGIVQLPPAENTLTHISKPGAIPGTPKYASPEQLAGKAPLTPASDVFSMGLVLYELLFGCLPKRSDAPPRLLTTHRFGQAGDAEVFILVTLNGALHPDPTQRLLTDRDLECHLRHIGAVAVAPLLHELQRCGFKRKPLKVGSRDFDPFVWHWGIVHPELGRGWMALGSTDRPDDDSGVSFGLIWDDHFGRPGSEPSVAAKEAVARLRPLLKLGDLSVSRSLPTSTPSIVLRAMATGDETRSWIFPRFLQRFMAEARLVAAESVCKP